jgi:hypothetical protein
MMMTMVWMEDVVMISRAMAVRLCLSIQSPSKRGILKRSYSFSRSSRSIGERLSFVGNMDFGENLSRPRNCTTTIPPRGEVIIAV